MLARAGLGCQEHRRPATARTAARRWWAALVVLAACTIAVGQLRADATTTGAGAITTTFLSVGAGDEGSPTTTTARRGQPPEMHDLLAQVADQPPATGLEPPWLRDPDAKVFELPDPLAPAEEPLLLTFREAPNGFTGPSGVRPTEIQQSAHFVPFEDRWRMGFPRWDRYDKGFPPVDDYPYRAGHWWDPYNQNVLKGDYPIRGQHTFLNVTVANTSLFEGRQLPTATTAFESTQDPFQEENFGNPNQFLFLDFQRVTFELNHGDAAFKPADWKIRATPIFNVNHLNVEELGVINPDVRQGRIRNRTFTALEEWFVESKIADLSPNYDFMSVRAGSQLFNSDFRGFIFSDVNRAIRLFGTRHAGRDEFNLIFFDQTEKDTNSMLNTFVDRHQNTLIANYYRQDFIWPGYTAQASLHYNHDEPFRRFDKNDFLARPDPVGVFRNHRVDSYYLGWTGEGHINRLNIAHAFYYVLGRDSFNPLAGRPQSISAQMAAVELSYDRDWIRFRSSFFYASGDGNTQNARANGFDTIFDNPNFAGGQFSYWIRQQIPLFGVSLTNRLSIVPDLRSSKFQGQTNFVNPGLFLYNVGYDLEITPKLRSINNCNFLWFDRTNPLETFVFQSPISHSIGTDLSTGLEYRPLLNNNILFVGGFAALVPSSGFRDLYNPVLGRVSALTMGFLEMSFLY